MIVDYYFSKIIINLHGKEYLCELTGIDYENPADDYKSFEWGITDVTVMDKKPFKINDVKLIELLEDHIRDTNMPLTWE